MQGKAFADTAGHWAKGAIATAAACGIISGYPDNTFRLRGKATRAEAFTVIVNALNK